MPQHFKSFRVPSTRVCPKCAAPLLLIARDVITSAGLVRFIWLCSFDGVGCNAAVAEFPDAISSGAVSVDDELFHEEISDHLRRWYREGNRAERPACNGITPEVSEADSVSPCDTVSEGRHSTCSDIAVSSEASGGPPKPETPAEETPGDRGGTA